MSAPRLYTYFRSGAAQRVRIGLALKSVTYDSVPVHLVRNGGEHLLPAFKAINPQARVPVLELSDGTALAQSSAILEYLVLNAKRGTEAPLQCLSWVIFDRLSRLSHRLMSVLPRKQT